MAPGPVLVMNEKGKAELQELENEDIDDPDSLSVLDPEKSRYCTYPFSASRLSNKSVGSATTEATRSSAISTATSTRKSSSSA